MKTFKPNYGRIAIKRDEAEEKSAGGIVLSANTKSKPSTGVVVFVSDGIMQKDGYLRRLCSKVGDRVAFAAYSGAQTVEVDGDKLIVLDEKEILGIIEA